MTSPENELLRLGLGALMGLGLGAIFGFLRPIRPRFLGDLLFVPILVYAWLVLSFQICRGDLRLAYCAAMGLGAAAWTVTLGRLIYPVFCLFWGLVGRILVFPWVFLKKTLNFMKKILASRKK